MHLTVHSHSCGFKMLTDERQLVAEQLLVLTIKLLTDPLYQTATQSTAPIFVLSG